MHHFATIGYLLAFLPAAALVGVITARFPARSYPLRFTGGLLAGTAAVLLCYLGGWAWLRMCATWEHAKALRLGISPFIVGELNKNRDRRRGAGTARQPARSTPCELNAVAHPRTGRCFTTGMGMMRSCPKMRSTLGFFGLWITDYGVSSALVRLTSEMSFSEPLAPKRRSWMRNMVWLLGVVCITVPLWATRCPADS